VAHSRDTVARVKAAAKFGIGVKVLAFHFGIPVETIREWLSGERQAEVEPDPNVPQDISDALLGRFAGRASSR